jgi:hypothetical protein
MASFVNAMLCVVTGVLPVFCTNCERKTKKSLVYLEIWINLGN